MSGVAGVAFSAACGALLANLERNPVRLVRVMALCGVRIQLVGV